MQEPITTVDPEAGDMAETRIELLIAQRLEAEQKKIGERIDAIDERLTALGKTVSNISGQLTALSLPPSKNDVHWTIKLIVAPLVVLLVAACIGLAYHSIDHRLNAIEQFITQNGGFIAGLKLEHDANNPTDPRSSEEVQRTLSHAKGAGLKIAAEVVKGVADKFVQAAQTNPNAWNTALYCADYTSFLNGNNPAAPSAEGSVLTTQYKSLTPPGERGPESMTVLGIVTKDKAAKLNVIGEDLNAHQTRGDAYIFVNGGGILLDNMDVRNVVFRNTHITYNGGPLKAEGVYFINCTFTIAQQSEGQRLLLTLLEESPITFIAQG